MFPPGTIPGSSNNFSISSNNLQPMSTTQNQPPSTPNYVNQISQTELNTNLPQTHQNQIPIPLPYQQCSPQIISLNTTNLKNTCTTAFSQAVKISHNNESDDDEDMNTEEELNDKRHPWQTITKKRKRIVQSKSTENMSSINTTNRFQVLTETKSSPLIVNNSNETNPKTQSPDPSPPPIYIYGVTDFKAMTVNLKQVVEDERFYSKSLSNNTVKINTKTIDGYRKLISHLRKENIVHHTYQVKQDRAYRVVIRDLHYSIPLQDIKDELHNLGHPVRNLINIRHRVSKDPLPMFFVDLEPQPNNKEIYKVEFIQNTKVRIEAPRIKNNIIQCTRCQAYGNSKAYCTKSYDCVRCGGPHDSKNCQKTRDTPATCALCNGDHPANYKGCTVYRDLKTRNIPKQPTIRMPNKTIPSTYTTSNHQPLYDPSQNSPTYSQIAARRTNNNDEITDKLTTFLNEFKNMFSQLINQNSMILTMLTTVINKFTQ